MVKHIIGNEYSYFIENGKKYYLLGQGRTKNEARYNSFGISDDGQKQKGVKLIQLPKKLGGYYGVYVEESLAEQIQQ